MDQAWPVGRCCCPILRSDRGLENYASDIAVGAAGSLSRVHGASEVGSAMREPNFLVTLPCSADLSTEQGRRPSRLRVARHH
jgi:hypothetical protein